MTTSSYIRMGYTWAPAARIKADADAVERDFAQIERETGSNGVALEAIVVRAKMPDSPMFGLLEHDTEAAAHEWHLEQAAHWVRSLRHRLVNTRTEDEVAGPRAYQPVRTVTDDRSRPGVYLKVTTVTAPEPERHAPPTSFTVTTKAQQDEPRHAPRVMAETWLRPTVIPQDTPPPAPVVTRNHDLDVVRLTESRERGRTALMKWAGVLEHDPYFADVVAAIRALG